MKKLIFIIAVLLLSGCSMQGSKAELKLKNGNAKVVYGVSVNDGYIHYYDTKENTEGAGKNKITVPLNDVQYIKELPDENQ